MRAGEDQAADEECRLGGVGPSHGSRQGWFTEARRRQRLNEINASGHRHELPGIADLFVAEAISSAFSHRPHCQPPPGSTNPVRQSGPPVNAARRCLIQVDKLRERDQRREFHRAEYYDVSDRFLAVDGCRCGSRGYVKDNDDLRIS